MAGLTWECPSCPYGSVNEGVCPTCFVMLVQPSCDPPAGPTHPDRRAAPVTPEYPSHWLALDTPWGLVDLMSPDPVEIGRGTEAMLPPAAKKFDQVSRRHLRITPDLASLSATVVDLGSTNKTYIGGVELTPGEATTLRVGQRVRLGQDEEAGCTAECTLVVVDQFGTPVSPEPLGSSRPGGAHD